MTLPVLYDEFIQIILEFPTLGGRLMLVDMADSENIEQAALKRVVEFIANDDSHVPFRDSKLTMLLQCKPRSQGTAQDGFNIGVLEQEVVYALTILLLLVSQL
ncbi:hypothetical protein L1987_00006 [Smallanthus sonchifolius]|uniref:Uncharacterized protein n=1 Tax=Smallanthus sonchifolius TaxID=185202 RepID=A0ACB9K153_9ASTR|nr:hypothetical protein L1987_00006 [Smallanthus sonchifolius]